MTTMAKEYSKAWCLSGTARELAFELNAEVKLGLQRLEDVASGQADVMIALALEQEQAIVQLRAKHILEAEEHSGRCHQEMIDMKDSNEGARLGCVLAMSKEMGVNGVYGSFGVKLDGDRALLYYIGWVLPPELPFEVEEETSSKDPERP